MSTFEIPKIVITGGPCAGKTEVISMLDGEYEQHIEVVPEAARLLIDAGFPMPDHDMPWTQEWQDKFQETILPMQMVLEDSAIARSRRLGKNLIICDRGLLDGAAYTEGGVEAFTEKFGLDLLEATERYESVIHLESVAASLPDAYEAEQRIEHLDIARQLEEKTKQAWRHHHAWTFVPAGESFDEKLLAVRSLVEQSIF